jgi:hypothetical protein
MAPHAHRSFVVASNWRLAHLCAVTTSLPHASQCSKHGHHGRWYRATVRSLMRHWGRRHWGQTGRFLKFHRTFRLIRQQVPPLRRRWRSGSGRDDRLFVVARTQWRCTPAGPSSSPVTGGWPTFAPSRPRCPMLRNVRSMGTTDDGIVRRFGR